MRVTPQYQDTRLALKLTAMKHQILVVTSALALSVLLLGCDQTVSKEESKTVGSDGSVKTKEKTVTQNADGTVSKSEETKKTTPVK